ncbi:hypothetical protein GCM10010528_15560 [Gordonia defluvii]|jgi:hypothetical protein|uniref:HTH-type transcriptional repressor Sco4008 C-terminal domain-containing protein n=2 Tax=Gordonia defluvii TaxID=283718 RepID=A0ABP6LDG0_9ACTN|nr:hypothetical protein [Gordonia sp. UBA5067]
MDPADLPGYAAALHDHAITQPEPMRLMRWGQLEFTTGATAEEDRDTFLAARRHASDTAGGRVFPAHADESPAEGSERH